jgi:AcrR family transcriptional regulator
MSEGQRPQSSREALLEAGLEAFTTRGYDGASVREIERRAGVNRGLVAYHFGTKLELWYAAVDWLMGDFLQELDRWREPLELYSPADRRSILVKLYVKFVAKRPEYLRMLVLEGRELTARSEWFFERYVRPVTAFYQEVSGRSDLSAEQATVEHFTLIAAGGLIFAMPAYCESIFDVDPTGPSFIERFANAMAGLAASPPRLEVEETSG